MQPQARTTPQQADPYALLPPGVDLAAEAAPIPRADPLKADMASMVPPGAVMLLAELDNAPGGAAAAAAEPDDDEVATLDFFGDEVPFVVIPLRYPFAWEGVRHAEVRVTQLTTGQLGRIEDRWSRTGKSPKLFDIYAEMTGLPAKVLRGLIAVDGEAVAKAGYDFLPPSYRPAAASGSEPPTG